MNPEISVIIPALNEKDTIGNVIRFLRDHQDGFVHEIIVADGGSTDGTVREAEKAGANRIVPTAKGRARQMNAGANVASGDLLWFLHADTTPPPQYDGIIVRSVQNGADFGCFTLRFDDPHPLLRFYAGFTRFRTMLMRFGDQSLFVKTSLFKKTGGFNESLIVMEDQEMARRLNKMGTFELLSGSVTTSAAKYRRNGIIKLQVFFTIIWLGYYLGARQETLVHLYHSLIEHSGI